MKTTTKLKNLINDIQILNIPGVHDSLCGCIAESVGFKALFAGGYTESAGQIARPDISLLTLTEMVDFTWRLTDAVEIPVLADCDTGFGNVSNVIRTIKLHEKAGAAGIFIEDQIFPKRCGHMTGKKIVPIKEMESKLKAALDTRNDDDFIIGARTDAIATDGIDVAIERGQKFAEIGADFIFIESPTSKEEMCRITSEIAVPTLANMVEGGKSPFLSADELQDIGYDLVIHPVSSTYTIAKAVHDMYAELFKTGTTKNQIDRMINFEQFNEFLKLKEIRKLEKRYSRNITNIKNK